MMSEEKCVCPYHTLQNHQDLTSKMENLVVKRSNSGNGVKRNFSNIEENRHSDYENLQEKKVQYFLWMIFLFFH